MGKPGLCAQNTSIHIMEICKQHDIPYEKLYKYYYNLMSLKSKNVVKFYVHISPIFSCRVT